jgi:hypothetical protein
MNKTINLFVLASIMLIITSTTMTAKVKAQSLDSMVADLKNQADALKAEIANTNLAGTGQVENLIYKVAYFGG